MACPRYRASHVRRPESYLTSREKRKRFTDEQIIWILKEAEAGGKTTELCRRHGISEQTFYRWTAKYGGLEVTEARRLRLLEHENGRLKRLVPDLTLDNQALKELVGKKA